MKAQQEQQPAASFIAEAPVLSEPVAAPAPEAVPEPVDEASDDGPKLSDADQFEKDTTTLTNPDEAKAAPAPAATDAK